MSTGLMQMAIAWDASPTGEVSASSRGSSDGTEGGEDPGRRFDVTTFALQHHNDGDSRSLR
jgi:hypothetical protein